MELWPAIDLRGGCCVRLQQGDYDRETVFGEDPVKTVKKFTSSGSRRLHIVDLEGAKDGAAIQADLIRQMVAAAGVPCQVCLLYTSPSPRDRTRARMPSSA